jgi:hypothetical protein
MSLVTGACRRREKDKQEGGFQMKTRLVLLLIGFMLLGLALSVLAAEPDSGGIKMGMSANNIKKLGTSEPSAAKLAAVIGHDRGVTNFLRRLVCGACGFLVLYTQLGLSFLETGSRARNASFPMTANIIICSIGMVGYQVRLFLARFFISRKEQREVCYVS